MLGSATSFRFLAAVLLAAIAGVAGGPWTGPASAGQLWFVSDPARAENKFGLAARIDLWRADDGSALGVRYRQTSLWDLDNDDDPFRVQTDFEPAAGVWIGPDRGDRWLGAWPSDTTLSLEFVHESNGLENELSRGWNRVQVALAWRSAVGVGLEAGVWRGFRIEPTNHDLLRHRGDGWVGASWHDERERWRLDLRAHYTFAGRRGRLVPSARLRVRWQAPVLRRHLPEVQGFGPLALLAEFWTGSAEFLHDYRREVDRLRIGIAVGGD